MILERFRKLAETYGADLQSWPAEERQSATMFIQTHPTDARSALADAAALDSMLDRYVVTGPAVELRERIIARSPAARTAWPRTQLWWQGAGLAGVGIAGALAGVLMIGVLPPLGA